MSTVDLATQAGADTQRRHTTSLLDALVHRRRGSAPRGTHRMAALCSALDDPQLEVPAIRIVGTDGKTSIARITTSLLRELGVRCGETTSPHLEQVAERIRLDGVPVDERRVAGRWDDLAAGMVAAEQTTGEAVTFFEAITALALRLFADDRLEVGVVEAGIGGLGDASSVVPGRLVVLGPVGLDHPELGATLAEVAAEKAGIIEPGGVLLAAPQPPEVTAVLDRLTADRGATLLRAGRDFGVATRTAERGGQHVDLRGLGGSGVRGFLPLHGRHQAANAAVALAAVQAHLGTTDLDPVRLRAGLATVHVPGRVELVTRRGRSDIVLDGAHEPRAVRALVDCLTGSVRPGPMTLVFGISGGRAPEPLLEVLGPLAAAVVATAASSPGAMPAQEVQRRLGGCGILAAAAADPGAAMALAASLTPADGTIVVTGSLHLVGEVRGQVRTLR